MIQVFHGDTHCFKNSWCTTEAYGPKDTPRWDSDVPLVNIQKNNGKSWETSPFLMGNLWVIYGKSWKNHHFLNGYINCKLLWLQVRKLLVITREIAMASIPEGKWCKNHRNETGCDFGTSSCLWCLRCSFFPTRIWKNGPKNDPHAFHYP